VDGEEDDKDKNKDDEEEERRWKIMILIKLISKATETKPKWLTVDFLL
jgi:hypothetical protein